MVTVLVGVDIYNGCCKIPKELLFFRPTGEIITFSNAHF